MGRRGGKRRRGPVVRETKLLDQVWAGKLQFTGASMARLLGMTTSSVKHMMTLQEVTEMAGGTSNLHYQESASFQFRGG